MQIHELKKTNKKKKERVGRGGKRGTYCGKGQKGQKSRSGNNKEPVVRGFIKKYHKLRGYKFNVRGIKERTVNLNDLEKFFESGQEVSPFSLTEKKILRKIKGRIPKVKILGNGDIKKSLNIKNCLISKSAKEKIEKAGGKILESEKSSPQVKK
jgi:large subunit ribosomal protein L15